MKRKRRDPKHQTRREPGNLSQAAGRTLTSYSVGALPILDRVIVRAKLEDFLREFMIEDKRCTVSPVVGTLVLLKNYLVSREPIYGVGDWGRQYVPGLLGLTPSQVASLNDDRVGRCLDRLFDADCSALVMAITRHVVEEFGIDLSEIHNDSTTITFYGAYDDASQEGIARGKKTPAVTWGHNKDHKPHLKQLLYNLTVTSDGAVPVVFGVENGNVTDDQTHRANWDLLCQIVGGAEFIYVADSKLATHANMTHIANRSGCFISVLPRTRSEDKEFRQKVLDDRVAWEVIHHKYDDDGKLLDTISTATEEASTAEGFRLLWFHSTRKVELDRIARNNKIGRAIRSLSSLRLKLCSPRTRYREESQVAKAVAKCLSEAKATDLIDVHILAKEREVFVQETPGRPSSKTRYRKELKTRFDIRFDEDREKIAEAEKQDGVFPLVTNERSLTVTPSPARCFSCPSPTPRGTLRSPAPGSGAAANPGWTAADRPTPASPGWCLRVSRPAKEKTELAADLFNLICDRGLQPRCSGRRRLFPRHLWNLEPEDRFEYPGDGVWGDHDHQYRQ